MKATWACNKYGKVKNHLTPREILWGKTADRRSAGKSSAERAGYHLRRHHPISEFGGVSVKHKGVELAHKLLAGFEAHELL